MQFEEIRFREPEKRRRPDRDPKRATTALGICDPEDLPIFIHLAAADAIERHALRDTSVELGGVLLGKECIDDQTGQSYVWIERSLEARHYENSEASFTYTHDSWEAISRERDRVCPELDIVGWYHTHPDFGIFLSGHDLFIHQNYFNRPLHVAYVVDPIRQTRGCFRWRGREITAVKGFHLVADRGDRVALARFLNDLENIPRSDHSNGLSPRLEAELMAMMNMSNRQRVLPMAASPSTSPVVVGVVGVILGILGLAMVLWLMSLTQSLREQGEQFSELQASIGRAESGQRLALDTLLAKAELPVSAGQFREVYDRLRQERDTGARKLLEQVAINEALATREISLKNEIVNLNKKVERQEFELSQATEELKTMKGAKEATPLKGGPDSTRTLSLGTISTWYPSAGWILSAVLAMGLLYAFLTRPHSSSPRDDVPPTEPDSPSIRYD